MPKNEDESVTCGFCKRTIEKVKDLETRRPSFGRLFTTVVCPHCKAVLGAYHA